MFWLLALSATSAAAESRLALLIGNQSYADAIGRLKNPSNDIALIGAALKQVGFEVVIVTDANRRRLLGAVSDFAARLTQAGPDALGFFYYSGHGVARPENRINYLIPTDLADMATADAWFDAVSLDSILSEIETRAPQAASFIVFDACRTELRLPVRSPAKGFTPVEGRPGMFIAFATSPNDVASDAGDKAGPYATALAAEIVRPGRDHLNMFQAVKVAVHQSTGQRQLAWERNGLLKTVFFAGAPSPSSPAPPTPIIELSARVWQDVKDTTSRGALEAFIREFPGSLYAKLAEAKLLLLPVQVASAPAATTTRGTLSKPQPFYTIPVFFGTDRQPANTAKGGKGLPFTSDAARALSVGQMAVSFPRDHKAGQIERPGSFSSEDPAKHATLQETAKQSGDQFSAALRQVAASKPGGRDALLYVHGWNTSIDYAAFRAAQLHQDLGFDGPLLLYSWPSQSSVRAYISDIERARAARPFMREFFELIARNSGIRNIHIIGHSTGAAAVLEILQDMAVSNSPGVAKLDQVILAAPDMDRAAFEIAAAKIGSVARGITVYVSANDKALEVSRLIAGGAPRAGDVPATGPVLIAGVDTIDVTLASQGTFAINHTTFAESSLVLNDMALLLRTGARPPDQRSATLQRVRTPGQKIYWRYEAN